MPKPGVGREGRALLVRRDREREGRRPPARQGDDPGHRSRVLEYTLQPGPGTDLRQMAFILTAFRNLIQLTSGDALALAIYQASAELGMTTKECWDLFRRLIKHSGAQFPKGFM